MASKNYSITLTSKSSPAFTIVELLVVIVVIGILAAITIVSYTGITSRATASALQSDLTNASQQLKLYQIDHSTYPTSLNASNCPLDSLGVVDTTYCLKPTSGNTFLYSSNNNSNPQTFSLYAINTSSSTKYRTTDSSSPTLATPVVATATGGYTVTNIGGYRIYTFTASGTFNVTSGDNVEVLVVGGGGGGGGNGSGQNVGGGGGGGGGVVYSPYLPVATQSYAVSVGAGGVGTTGTPMNGSDSVFSSLTAVGGGSGFGWSGSAWCAAKSGSSGGGGGYSLNNGALGTANQGNTGGNGISLANFPGGGGGGAGSVGQAAPSNNAGGNGGFGIANTISGAAVYYGGGGGGGLGNSGNSGVFGTGGNGGGGSGSSSSNGANGTSNSGGGGGGAGNNIGPPYANTAGGSGGSGIVIIRYPN